MPQIKNKKEFFEKSELGLCGNTALTWPNLFMALSDPREIQYFGIRWHSPGNARFKTALDRATAAELQVYGELDPYNGRYYVSESDGINVRGDRSWSGGFYSDTAGLQGELSKINGQWYLYYALLLGNMRLALRYMGQHAVGLAALDLMRRHLSGDDYDSLMELFDHYTEGEDCPTIEFSNNPMPMGRLGRNMVIWEIRNGY